jgi:hypothetical protein
VCCVSMEKTELRGRLFPTLRELEVRHSGYDGWVLLQRLTSQPLQHRGVEGCHCAAVSVSVLVRFNVRAMRAERPMEIGRSSSSSRPRRSRHTRSTGNLSRLPTIPRTSTQHRHLSLLSGCGSRANFVRLITPGLTLFRHGIRLRAESASALIVPGIFVTSPYRPGPA